MNLILSPESHDKAGIELLKNRGVKMIFMQGKKFRGHQF